MEDKKVVSITINYIDKEGKEGKSTATFSEPVGIDKMNVLYECIRSFLTAGA